MLFRFLAKLGIISIRTRKKQKKVFFVSKYAAFS